MLQDFIEYHPIWTIIIGLTIAIVLNFMFVKKDEETFNIYICNNPYKKGDVLQIDPSQPQLLVKKSYGDHITVKILKNERTTAQ